MCGLPEPHPLDFDWRYDAQTVARISALLTNRGRVLALGTPSIARHLESEGREVVLLDRQPCQLVRTQITSELELQSPLQDVGCVIADPPWYPEDLLLWATFAGRSVGTGNSVFISVWPASTRPDAAEELRATLHKISNWASISFLPTEIHYDNPMFEQLSIDSAHGAALSSSPRAGQLLELRVKTPPLPLISAPRHRPRWTRFLVNDYQLGVRFSQRRDNPPLIRPLSNAQKWQWPYVSSRAPGREDIDLWSSRNEVASIGDSKRLIFALRAAFAANDDATFKHALTDFPHLLEWDIPCPPYRRFREWTHLQ